jgi:acyl carrier protein
MLSNIHSYVSSFCTQVLHQKQNNTPADSLLWLDLLCRFLARLPAVPSFLDEVAPTAAAATAKPGVRPTGRPAAAAAAAAAAPGISLAGIAPEVSSAVAAVVGRQLEQESSLMESGLDSLGAVELRNSLAASFAMELPATLVSTSPPMASLLPASAERPGRSTCSCVVIQFIHTVITVVCTALFTSKP